MRIRSISRRGRNGRRSLALLLTALGGGAFASGARAAAVLPPWYDAVNQTGYKTSVPDFYQHQYLAGNPGGVAGWEAFGGWCRPTALTDALYTFAANGYPNLLPAGFNT